MLVTNTGQLRIDWGDGTGEHFQGSSAGEITTGEHWWIRSTLDVVDGANHHWYLYKSKDPIFTNVDDVTWELIADNPETGTTSIAANGVAMTLGRRDGASHWSGHFHGAWVYDGIGGTLVADPDYRSGDIGSDTVGNTWSKLNGAIWSPPLWFSVDDDPQLAPTDTDWVNNAREP
jgi:hypothetical protein